MSLKHGILGLLQYGAMSGYDLVSTFKDSLKHFWEAQPSQIYREANKLEELSWAKSSEEIQSGKPNKRVYQLTPKGQEEFTNWLCNLRDGEDDIRSAFTMRIFFLSRMGTEQAIALINSYAASCTDRLNELAEASRISEVYQDQRGVAPTDPLGWRLSMSFGVYQYRAGLEWAQEAIAMVKKQKESS